MPRHSVKGGTRIPIEHSTRRIPRKVDYQNFWKEAILDGQ